MVVGEAAAKFIFYSCDLYAMLLLVALNISFTCICFIFGLFTLCHVVSLNHATLLIQLFAIYFIETLVTIRLFVRLIFGTSSCFPYLL